MLTGAILAGSCLGGAALWRLASREHGAALRQRASLLDEAARHLGGAISLGPDSFPTLSAELPEGELAVSLLADTLVTRRLPQLWLVLTLREAAPVRDFSLGGLARPTGAEFYALTHTLPDWIMPPPGEVPLLLRGQGVVPDASGSHAATLAALFADPQLKEAAATPRGVRIVRQVSQGERGAHLLLRQARFAAGPVSPMLVSQALDEARRVSATLRSGTPAMLRRAA